MQTIKIAAALLMVLQLVTIQAARAGNTSSNTSKQIAAVDKIVTGMPRRNTYGAPGNLSLQQTGQTQLPATRLDSFVAESGFSDAIYGDENIVYSNDDPHFPGVPGNGFTREHRIEAGIVGDRAKGLTTGHGSVLPSAWGNEEFIASADQGGWSQSAAATQEESMPSGSEDSNVQLNAWQDAN